VSFSFTNLMIMVSSRFPVSAFVRGLRRLALDARTGGSAADPRCQKFAS
jgi:hypothetical protein